LFIIISRTFSDPIDIFDGIGAEYSMGSLIKLEIMVVKDEA
jgi:hypothetical protein